MDARGEGKGRGTGGWRDEETLIVGIWRESWGKTRGIRKLQTGHESFSILRRKPNIQRQSVFLYHSKTTVSTLFAAIIKCTLDSNMFTWSYLSGHFHTNICYSL